MDCQTIVCNHHLRKHMLIHFHPHFQFILNSQRLHLADTRRKNDTSCRKNLQTLHESDNTVATYSNKLLHCYDPNKSHKITYLHSYFISYLQCFSTSVFRIVYEQTRYKAINLYKPAYFNKAINL